MVGLTATPANFIDRDTFVTFRCEGQTPTFLYTYQHAIKDERLVDYRLYQAQTGFQRKGIKGADLDDEDRETLIAQGSIRAMLTIPARSWSPGQQPGYAAASMGGDSRGLH